MLKIGVADYGMNVYYGGFMDYASVFMIVDTSGDSTVKVEIYNSVGAKIATVENVEFDDDVLAYAASTNAILLVGEDDEGDTVYYRIG